MDLPFFRLKEALLIKLSSGQFLLNILNLDPFSGWFSNWALVFHRFPTVVDALSASQPKLSNSDLRRWKECLFAEKSSKNSFEWEWTNEFPINYTLTIKRGNWKSNISRWFSHLKYLNFHLVRGFSSHIWFPARDPWLGWTSWTETWRLHWKKLVSKGHWRWNSMNQGYI